MYILYMLRTYIHMHTNTYMYVCTVCMYVCTVCMYVYMYVQYVCMYICMYSMYMQHSLCSVVPAFVLLLPTALACS